MQTNGSTNENLLMFEKSSGSCALTLLNTYNVAADPYDIVYDRTNRLLYVANAGSASISSFKVDFQNKQLTNQNITTQPGPGAGVTPYGMSLHHSGYLFSADGNANGSIAAFSQNISTGQLTSLTPGFTGIGSQTWFVAVTQDYLYATDYGNAQIRQYNINSSTGALSAMGTATVASGNNPWSIFVHSSGNYVYATNSDAAGGSVSQYLVDGGNGQLSQIAAPVSAGTRTIGLAVGTDYLYAAGNTSGAIYQFSINQATGQLSALTPASVSTQNPNPYGMALSKDETCLYVSELNGNNGAGVDAVAIYTISNGLLTYTSQISAGLGPRFIAPAW